MSVQRGVIAALLAAVFAVGAVVGGGADGRSLSRALKCPIFPRDSAWNVRVDKLPLAANSSAIVDSIGADETMHADFGSGLYEGGPIGIPYVTVPATQKRVPVSFGEPEESDPGPYPIPPNAPIEGGRNAGGDRHVIVVDRGRCRLYELYYAKPVDGGRRWTASSGARWNLRSNKLRPSGWTSADAAGLPILPGLARYEELRKGGINHALRFTAPRTRGGFLYPARHEATDSSDPNQPAMGQRLRLKAGFDVSGFPPQARAVLTALKRYGMILADHGSPWFVSGAPSSGWDNEDLHSLDRVRGSDFEVVDPAAIPRPKR